MSLIDHRPQVVERNPLARRPNAAGALQKLVDVAADAEAFAAASRSPSTRRCYSRQWLAFVAWCREHGLAPLPAEPETLALYLTARARAGLKVATLTQALAAIGAAHKLAGHASPQGAPAVQQVWEGIRRKLGTAQRRVAPVVVDSLRRMVGAQPKSLIGTRDRALLVIGFAGGFRRSELVALDAEHVTFSPDGLVVRVVRSKTDQEGAGESVGLPFGSSPATCPVRLLRAWLSASGIERGALFRSVRSGGQLGERLGGVDVARRVKAAAVAAGLDPSTFSGHSLRAGLATSAAKAGKSDRAIMRQGRWTSRSTVDRYVRDAQLLDSDNAASGIGL